MANGFIQLVAFVMMMAAAVMTICICVFPEWKTNDTQGEVIETIRRSQGLWISCMTMSSGHWQCDQYDQFFLGLPAPLQCARACVCMALALQAIAFLVSFAGLDCTNLISTYPEDDPEEINKNLKKKLMLGVGIINIVCAVLLAVGVSYFAATVLEEFYSYEQQQQYTRGGMGRGSTNVAGQMSTIGRYIYGECLFIGWGAMVTYFVAGGLMLCGSCGNASVGTHSYYGGNTMQNRLLSQQRGGTAPISSEFQMPPKAAGFDQPRDYI